MNVDISEFQTKNAGIVGMRHILTKIAVREDSKEIAYSVAETVDTIVSNRNVAHRAAVENILTIAAE